jgi:hypothetical protein
LVLEGSAVRSETSVFPRFAGPGTMPGPPDGVLCAYFSSEKLVVKESKAKAEFHLFDREYVIKQR